MRNDLEKPSALCMYILVRELVSQMKWLQDQGVPGLSTTGRPTLLNLEKCPSVLGSG